MIEAVIFDMDGLLIDSERITYETYKTVCASHNRVFSKAQYQKQLGTNMNYIQACITDFFDNATLANHVIQEVHDRLEACYANNEVPLKLGVRPLIRFLREKGIKIGLATSSDRTRAIKLLGSHDIWMNFDAIVCGDEVKESKPNPEIFLKACEALKVEPANAMVLEDSENGIIGASKGGMIAVNVPDFRKPSMIIKSKAHYIVPNLNEVIRIINIQDTNK